MLQLDCYTETSTCLRLHPKDLATSTQEHAGTGRGRNANRHLYHGTLLYQKRARKQNASEADVLRVGVYFLVSQCERDRQVHRVARFVPSYWLGGVHAERVGRTSLLLTGHGGAFGHEQKANVGDIKIDQFGRFPR